MRWVQAALPSGRMCREATPLHAKTLRPKPAGPLATAPALDFARRRGPRAKMWPTGLAAALVARNSNLRTEPGLWVAVALAAQQLIGVPVVSTPTVVVKGSGLHTGHATALELVLC